MSEYKVISECGGAYKGAPISHKYFHNGNQEDELGMMDRWKGIASFHEQFLRRWPTSQKIETMEKIK